MFSLGFESRHVEELLLNSQQLDEKKGNWVYTLLFVASKLPGQMFSFSTQGRTVLFQSQRCSCVLTDTMRGKSVGVLVCEKNTFVKQRS